MGSDPAARRVECPGGWGDMLQSEPALHSSCSSGSCPVGLGLAPCSGLCAQLMGSQCHSDLAWLTLCHEHVAGPNLSGAVILCARS